MTKKGISSQTSLLLEIRQRGNQNGKRIKKIAISSPDIKVHCNIIDQPDFSRKRFHDCSHALHATDRIKIIVLFIAGVERWITHRAQHSNVVPQSIVEGNSPNKYNNSATVFSTTQKFIQRHKKPVDKVNTYSFGVSARTWTCKFHAVLYRRTELACPLPPSVLGETYALWGKWTRKKDFKYRHYTRLLLIFSEPDECILMYAVYSVI